MNYAMLAAAAVFIALRLWQRRRKHVPDRPARPGILARRGWTVSGDVPLVAAREIRERTRGRIFRIGTVLILLAVAAAVVIPTLHGGSSSSREKLGVVGPLSDSVRGTITGLGQSDGTTIDIVTEPTVAMAKSDLNAGQVKLVIVDSKVLLVKTTFGSDDTSTFAGFAQALATSISLQRTLDSAGISPALSQQLVHPIPIPIVGLHPAHKQTSHTVTVYGLIMLFVLLGQYGTWILMGVVEEKSSRVVEVLLATLKPVQLLAGKVLGIGLVALAQAALIVTVALGLGAAVGSDLLHGSGPKEVFVSLVWLILGYTFYCWVYAAAGSLATRQEHIQTLAFPLQIPLILGYITSLTALSSGTASTFVRVLAYLPPTAPFAMPVLVALGQATWWEFSIAVALSLLGTLAIARLAASVYERAILRTGQRVRLRELRSARHPVQQATT